MMYEQRLGDQMDYAPCQYGHSKLIFRGPKREPEEDYSAVLGGSAVFGKLLKRPFPAQLEFNSGAQVINLGCVNAGIDSFYGDPSIIGLCSEAQVTVLQILCAQNMSNRYYTVHPRRNDRFLAPSDKMRGLYPEVDFTRFSFTGHMLQTLQALSQERFQTVAQELRHSWVARMRSLIGSIGGPVVLLWFEDHPPSDEVGPDMIRPGKTFVLKDMIREVAAACAGYCEVVFEQESLPETTSKAVITEGALEAMTQLPGPNAHAQAAKLLEPLIAPYLQLEAAASM